MDGTSLIHKYLRVTKKFPHIWCAGCGIGIFVGSLIRAIDKIGYEKDEVCLISGIGCSGRITTYLDFNTLHTTHGRALTFATGIKLANPLLKVIVVMGDGDATAIGGNHLIHAARRNLDIKAIILNNDIYGMTGGQHSPATPYMSRSVTAPYGHIEQAFDIARLLEGGGAPFVARSTVYHANLTDSLLIKAFNNEGFSVVEVISHCHTYFGKFNIVASPVEMMKWQRDKAIPVEKVGAMKKEELIGRFPIGVLVDKEAPSYLKEYAKIKRRAKSNGKREE